MEHCQVEIVSETGNDFQAYCPYHGNNDTAAFNVSKSRGSFICFNPACGVHGSLEELVRQVTKANVFQAKRIILKKRNESAEPFSKRLEEALQKTPEFTEWKHAASVPVAAERFWQTPNAVEYMHDRHFDDETLRYFEVGYTNKPDARTGKPKNMITVPMHDPTGVVIGVIGREASHTNKVFKNSPGLPKSKTMYNLHRARKHGEAVVVVEASFDAMRVHQAGYPNVVGLIGGSLSPSHIHWFNRYFSTIIIMTDYDEKIKYPGCRKCRNAGFRGCQGHRPGRDLGWAINDKMRGKRILWAAHNDKTVYPSNILEGYRTGQAKDPGNMTDEEIRYCLKNAVTTMEYRSWGID